jgi:integration host factor subunit alpha
MTLTKADLAKSVREKVRFKKKKRERQQYLFPEFDYELLSPKRSTELVDATFETVKRCLEKGENLLITGFGKFQIRFKWARKGRNPRTGKPIILDSHRVVTFHCSPKLKEKINGE